MTAKAEVATHKILVELNLLTGWLAANEADRKNDGDFDVL
jgi:hypothetical protein